MLPEKGVGPLTNVKVTPIRWVGSPSVGVQVRQIQTASQPQQVTTQRNIVTINQPQPVSGLFLNVRALGGMRKLTISFLQNPSDPNYQKVNVHLKLGPNLPVIVASGSQSPITVMAQSTHQPATIFVQAEGNWGPHPLAFSPSRSFSLM